MQKLPLVVTFLIMITACNTEERTAGTSVDPQTIDSREAMQEEPLRKETTSTTDTLAFKPAFNQFLTALQASDTATINRFIHPKYGLWVIEQPGALPKMTHVSNINAFKREYQDRSFFTVREEVKSCNLKEEVWPTFDCAHMDYDARKSGYSKDGCFAWKPDKFKSSAYWDYASLQPAQIQRIKSVLPLVQKSVLHTPTSFEFHFGFVDGNWRLLFTKLIYPCSA